MFMKLWFAKFTEKSWMTEMINGYIGEKAVTAN